MSIVKDKKNRVKIKKKDLSDIFSIKEGKEGEHHFFARHSSMLANGYFKPHFL